MASPNLKSPTSIIGHTEVYAVTTTLAAVLTNAAASNKSYKVNSIFCANVDGVNAADISISIQRSATDRYLVRTIAVPADATQVISSRETYFYLEEGDALRAQASANGDLELVIGWEEIS